MAIQNLTLMDGATSLSVTGGTGQLFTPDGQAVNNGMHVAANAVQDYRIRPHISFRNVNPRKMANGSFTTGFRQTTITEPYLHTDGLVYYQTTEIVQRYHPVIPAANMKNGRYKACQVLFDAEAEDFNVVGSLA